MRDFTRELKELIDDCLEDGAMLSTLAAQAAGIFTDTMHQIECREHEIMSNDPSFCRDTWIDPIGANPDANPLNSATQQQEDIADSFFDKEGQS
jgi:hypothetical protein